MPAPDKKPVKRTVQSVINELVERTNSNTQRLRILEQRSESIDTKITGMEKELLDYSRDMKRMIQETDTRVSTSDERVVKIENTISRVAHEEARHDGRRPRPPGAHRHLQPAQVQLRHEGRGQAADRREI